MEDVLAKASIVSASYEWMRAAELYEQALAWMGPEYEPLETARITELLARSYYKGAFQAKHRDEFKRRMQLSEASNERASAIYERTGNEAAARQVKAREEFAAYWGKDDYADRGSIINRCIVLADEAVRLFEGQGDKRRLAEAHKDLLTYLLDATWYTIQAKNLKEQYEKAIGTGLKAIEEFENFDDQETILECLHTIVFFLIRSSEIVEPARYRELTKKAEALVGQMTELARNAGTPYAHALAEQMAGWIAFFTGDTGKLLVLRKSAAVRAEGTGDSLLIGDLNADLAHSAKFAGTSGGDEEQMRRILGEGVESGEKSVKSLEISSSPPTVAWAYSNYAECYWALATFVETEPPMKEARLRRAIDIARVGMKYEDPEDAWSDVGHALSKALYSLATIEADPEAKRPLLKEALALREQTLRKTELRLPDSWDAGVMRNYLALLKTELAKTTDDSASKIDLLNSAVSDMEQCLFQCTKAAERMVGVIPALAQFQEWFGNILCELYGLTKAPESAEHAVKIYEDTIVTLRKVEHMSSIAGVRWKTARIYDALGDYKQASTTFTRAAEDYKLASEKVPGSLTAFTELASYMQAWSLIEEARLHHGQEQYLLATENYTNAAEILRETRSWSQLAKHYTACSFLERGEAMSRQERHETALQFFNEAVKAFQETRTELARTVREGPGSHEMQELKTWLDVTHGRERYCQGRATLEEAKVLDQKGDEEESARKYRSASEIFRGLLGETPAEESRREMETLMLFCEAWAKMKQAETEASVELYSEAVESFRKAKETATTKRLRLLALANASICKSLESGTLFRSSRNTQLYSEIKKQLETATDYYQEAGIQNAADWTRATGNLFDALVHLTDAATERDSRKKTEFYRLAEKHLQLAAKLYGQAGYPVKREGALKHLQRAKEEKELLLTPVEALAESPALIGMTVAPVSLIRDQAMGLERFEAANVVGNMSLAEKEVGVGEDLLVELEMANVGKTAATLMKLENIAAEGLELNKARIRHRVEDNFIDLKGKRLEHLKTHEVKLPMKAKTKGTFELRPRILFVDEKGNYRSYEFEPIALTVRELGISGWLKGPQK